MDLVRDYGIPWTAVIFLGVVVLIIAYLDSHFGYWRRRGVTSINFWGYLMHAYDITRKSVPEILLEQYKKYGRIHGFCMGPNRQLSVADPTLLKQILVKDFRTFTNRAEFKKLLGETIFNKMLMFLEDEDWKRVRCIVSPTFTSSRMRKMSHLVKDAAENFARYCEKIAEKNEELDCKTCYSKFAIEIIASTAFGTKLNSFENLNHPFVKNAKNLFARDNAAAVILTMFFPVIFKFVKFEDFFGEAFTYLRDFALHVINERDEKNIRANDFLQLMLDAQRGRLENTEEDGKEGSEELQIPILPRNRTMSVDEVIAQCMLFFVAAGDTISTTLAFLSYYLALHPECQQRLIAEIDEAWEKNEEINYDVLGKLTYLDAVFCEVLRLQPVSAQLLRVASEDYKLGDTGIIVEKGIIISIPVQAIHKDPEFFPEPEVFNPERFMPENRKNILPFTYLPFGEGPRNCIGTRFAMMELKLCAVHLLKRIQFEATEGTKKRLVFYKGSNLIQPKEVMLKLVKRE